MLGFAPISTGPISSLPAAAGGTTPVSTSRSTTWNVKSVVAASRATTWNTLSAVATSRATTWDVASALTPVSTTRATSWDVKASIASTRATTWNTSARVTAATRSTTWNTLAAVGPVTRLTTWNTKAAVAASRSTTWDVATSLAQVATSRSTTWNVKAQVIATRPTTWDVLLLHRMFSTPTRSARRGRKFHDTWFIKDAAGLTLARIDGVWSEHENPPPWALTSADLVYLGGRTYELTAAEEAVLTAAGYGANVFYQ